MLVSRQAFYLYSPSPVANRGSWTYLAPFRERNLTFARKQLIPSMDLLIPYIACLMLALFVYLALRPSPLTLRIGMIVAGVAAAGWLVGLVTGAVAASGNSTHDIFFLIFGLSAVGSAIRMVTHDRPVYCALHFVVVVIASAGLLLLLEAEFMAFALIIVYAGAILITYMFVLMLANQADNPDELSTQTTFDQLPREPASAVAVGFLMLCLVTGTVMRGSSSLPTPNNPMDQWNTLAHLQKQFESSVLDLDPSFMWPPVASDEGAQIRHDGDGAFIISSEGVRLQLTDDMLPQNTQQVGWSLVNDYPVSLELAGVILLMAMFGAAVLARRSIELADQEKQAAMAAHDAKIANEGGTDS